jgi:hypothetical protein
MAGSKMLARHINALKAMKGKKVESGWFETDRYPSGRSVAANARVQEFGAIIKRGDTIITIPARPFMRLAWSQFSQKRHEIQAKVAYKMVNESLTPNEVLGLIGLALEAEITRSIKNGNWEPNAPSTVRNKGFNRPLVHSSLMGQSVSSKVS